jgi:hypothetical protein
MRAYACVGADANRALVLPPRERPPVPRGRVKREVDLGERTTTACPYPGAPMVAFPDLVPELCARLRLAPEDFDAFVLEYLGAIPTGRPYGPEQLEHALAYPWARPARSYVLSDTEVELFDDMDELARERVVEAFARERHPLLAFGSNAAPSTLIRKFAHFEDPQDREVLVVAGDLHGFDVGPAASVAVYGAMPATLSASAGTAVRAAILYVTDAQATQLTWSELTYGFGRLDGIRFDVEEADVEVTTALGYVSRFGTYAPDGQAAALAAIPAAGRTARANDQRELLDGVAARTLGSHATAEDVVAGVFGDFRAFGLLVRDHIRPLGQPFASDHWTPFS